MAAGRYNVTRRRDVVGLSNKYYDDHYRAFTTGAELSRGNKNGYVHKLDNGHGRAAFGWRTKTQELGLLSSGTWIDSPLSKTKVKENEISAYEIDVGSPPEKKRKFSPVIWDRKEKKVRVTSKNRVVPASTIRLTPSPPRSLEQGLNVVPDMDSVKYPASAHKVHGMEISAGMKVSKSSGNSLPQSVRSEHFGGIDLEGQLEKEDEGIQSVNILTSRWASNGDSPMDIEVVCNSNSFDKVLYKKRLSAERGKLSIEGLDGNTSRSSGSDSGHECSEYDFSDYSSVDIDERHNGGIDGADQVEDDDHIEEPAPFRNMIQGCRSVFEYEKLNKINEGTYGIVYRARDKKTEEIVALKKVKMGVERDGFPLSSLREINILLSFDHPSIVGVKEVVMDDLDSVFMVMEYMEHDVKGLMEVIKQPLSISEIKCLMLQLLDGVNYLHDNWVLHRDLKTSNLLLNNKGELKICDFGMSRQYGSTPKLFTELVVTLWYRAPELLLGAKQYSTAIDMWSVGCIMAELITKKPLFNGKTEVDQLDKIFNTLGTPNETIWPGYSTLPGVKVNFVKQTYNLLRKKFPASSFTGYPALSDAGFDLLSRLLTYDPNKRISAADALNHDWFKEVPLAKSKDFMPTFPALNVQDRHLRR